MIGDTTETRRDSDDSSLREYLCRGDQLPELAVPGLADVWPH